MAGFAQSDGELADVSRHRSSANTYDQWSQSCRLRRHLDRISSGHLHKPNNLLHLFPLSSIVPSTFAKSATLTSKDESTCLKTIPWHAVNLCGISKSNRLAYSWDPIVVIALLYAGKSLSYRGQQNEMLQHFKALADLTGWKMRQEIQRLKELWKAGQ
jgi:hypothetical protein